MKKVKYIRDSCNWYRKDTNEKLFEEEIPIMLANTEEKLNYFLWIAVPDIDTRIWNTDNEPI